MELMKLNAIDPERARNAFTRCCGAVAWVDSMIASRPFASRDALLAASERAAQMLTREDWLQAFACHPRIGDLDALREKFAAMAAWAGAEQRAVAGASDAVLEALARGNQAYERRFGYIFIVCATARRADEMLAMLEARLPNDPAHELAVAAAEQMQITRLRLLKLLEEP
jgi:2-oxo-4-hydroxy-4-carboxy-5-ureidoimidazoline decarboxylase